MAKEVSHGQVEINMLENLKIVKEMEKELLHG